MFKYNLSRKVMLFCIFIGFWILIAPQVWGCSVPVFRYALERWPADLYEVIVFHRGPLSSEKQALLEKLQYGSEANIYVSTYDISGKSNEQMLELWESQSAAELPWMVLSYPRLIQASEPVWTAHFDAAAVEMLVHSPARKKIADRILEGDSAVWILMESGVKEQDEATALFLDTQLKRMEENLQVPEQDDFEEYMGYELEEDIKIAFSVVRLSRTDPEEQVLIQTLLRNDPELQATSKPVAFPVFGRGRALCALMSDDIDELNIEEISMFLTGPCSCQVKSLNPGMDLLISVDWDGMLYQQIEGYAEQPLVINNTVPITVNDQKPGALKRNILLVALIQVAVVILATSVVLWRRKRKET